MANEQMSPREKVMADRRVLVRIVRMVFLILFFVVTLVYVLEPLQRWAQGERNTISAIDRPIDRPIERPLDRPVDRPTDLTGGSGAGAGQGAGTGADARPPLRTGAVGSGARSSAADFQFQVDFGWWITLLVAFLFAGTIVLVDLLTPRKRLSLIFGVFFGLVAGMLGTFLLSFVLELLVAAYQVDQPQLINAIKVLMGIALCYFGISVVLQTQDDFRLAIPYIEFAKQIRGPKPMVVDTSVLIDGRIVEVAQTGFVQVPMVVPRFVIEELQRLGDSTDRLKRAKGRRGMETIGTLQRLGTLDLSIDETPVPGKGVDQQLIELAKALPGGLLTADGGLMKMAGIRGVSVVSLPALAASLKPALLPGETLRLRVLRRGEQPGQGVGFLDDGTMIVVENGASSVGQEVGIEVTSSVQTSAGRLIFARVSAGVASEQPTTGDRPTRTDDVGTDEDRAAASEHSAGESMASADEPDPAAPDAAGEPGPEQPEANRAEPMGEPRRVPPPTGGAGGGGGQRGGGPIGPGGRGKTPNRNPRR
jgi:uncharacterized protein YacL